MKVSDIKSYEDYNKNKKKKYVCRKCHYEYDLKKNWKCPYCGTFPEKQ